MLKPPFYVIFNPGDEMKLEQYSYSARKEKQRKIFSIVSICLIVFIVIHLTLSFVIFPVNQTSNSMAPDVVDNSLLMVTPLPLKVKRGDVVYIAPRTSKEMNFAKKTANLLTKFFTAQRFNLENNNNFPGTQNEIRRVIGMPGDSYYIRDYVMYIKPAGQNHYLTEFEVCKKKYNVNFSVAPSNWDSSIGVKGYSDEYTLGPDEYFVLGDNRKTCSDSRLYGPVTADEIKGKALFTYFPFNKIKFY